MVKIIFVNKDNEVVVDANIGQTLLEVAHSNDIDSLIGNCGGAGVCGTCHVYIDEDFIKNIKLPTEDEEDVLDIVFKPKSNSRLACQITVTEKMENMRVFLVS